MFARRTCEMVWEIAPTTMPSQLDAVHRVIFDMHLVNAFLVTPLQEQATCQIVRERVRTTGPHLRSQSSTSSTEEVRQNKFGFL